MKKELFSEEVKNEIKVNIEEMLTEGEKIEFTITGEDMFHVYNRIATNPVTNVVPMGLASNPIVTKSQEHMRLFFTNKRIIAVGLDYYKQPLNYEIIKYEDIKSSFIHEKDDILEINTMDDKRLAITINKNESIEKLKEKLNLQIGKTKFESKSRTAFRWEVALGLIGAAILIIIILIRQFG